MLDSSPSNFIFPPIIQGGRKRYFNRSWLRNYPWLVYSECLTGAFCKICVIFLDRNDKRVGKGGTQKVGYLVIHPFTGYKNAINHYDNHSKLAYHRECCAKSEAFKRVFENPGLDVRDQLNQERIKIKHLNRKRLVPIIEIILFLGRQELTFRGHRGESEKLIIEEPKQNDGNFRAALRLRLKGGIRF
ncbi:52 kDa repressor of the inhibitor of the protein kinase-like [Oopsacas minuta]|uniref:52 kDa repressor of the inhibitor of the protein kinase-like n=1 Tax=Oopsacas minuta TaxID=111878 RepID=A0AAV7JDH3_9METZ|nr:52 kDa repressor of the inhibitor of the protein kinase-like [Oopsacas minuta]